MALQSTVLTCIAAVAQIVALVYFIVSYVPGGQTGKIVIVVVLTLVLSCKAAMRIRNDFMRIRILQIW